MCKVLRVSRSSYYNWKRYPLSKRMLLCNKLDEQIKSVYFRSKGCYGSPRIAAELCCGGNKVSHRTVAKHMKQMGLRSKLSRKYRPTTDSSHKEAIAENLLNRDFSSSSYGMKCVSDITYLPTNDGFLYLTIVMDLFNRDIIGWSLSSNMTAQNTVITALSKAAKNTLFQDGMIFHSDRGVQYAASATVNTLKSYNIAQSMSRKGNCWDNAEAESFFKSLKTELIYGSKLLNKQQMKTAIFEYIEIWYRKQRRHSYLGYQTIIEFNNKYNKQIFKHTA